MSDQLPDPHQAGRRFLEAASILGLDTSLMWGVRSDSPQSSTEHGVFSQAILAVVGTGRTAMLFLSGIPNTKGLWRLPLTGTPAHTSAMQRSLGERIALIERACAEIVHPGPVTGEGIVLAQALLDPPGTELAAAFTGAGFMRLGDLAYMRLDFSLSDRSKSAFRTGQAGCDEVFPPDLRVANLAALLAEGMSQAEVDRLLIESLQQSYIDTLDCPELCGMREPADVLVSHRSVGQFDPRLWWVVIKDGKGVGCVLLNQNAETDSVELVYLGIGPAIRGMGMGMRLMRMALQGLREVLRVSGQGSGGGGKGRGGAKLQGGVTCAVDVRNVPAMKLYQRLGFARFGLRVPLVRALHVV